MKKVPNLMMAFLFLIASEQSVAKNVILGPGYEVTTGRVLSSKWVNYQISGGRFIGTLEVRIRLIRAPFVSTSGYNANYNLPAQGSSIAVTSCISNDAGYGGCYNNIPFPAASCTSADQGDINICMNRIVGAEGTLMLSVNEPTYSLSSSSFCMRSTLGYPQVTAPHPIPWLVLSFNPDPICGTDEGAPPPVPELTGSVCNLNSQNLNLNYSSTSLNVDGLTQSTNLNVSCTAGSAQNYQLKLTGTNVTNGRLNFNNGASAQVSLNGTQVQANGSGIQLNSLTSRTISVSAMLTGTASVSGVSNTTGILILEAQ